jgi:hypothetical protein
MLATKEAHTMAEMMVDNLRRWSIKKDLKHWSMKQLKG